MADIRWKVSEDGKTIVIGGKSYSKSAFESQFKNITAVDRDGGRWSGPRMFSPGNQGTAEKNPNAPKVVTPKVDSSPDKAKSRAEAKRYKKSVKKMSTALQSRKQGGITESGAKKNVNPVYRNIGRGGGLGGLFGKLPK